MPKRKRVIPKLSAANERDLPEEDSNELPISPVAKRTRSATKVKQSAEICHSEHLFCRFKLIARKIFMNSNTHVQYSYSLNPIDCSENFVLKHYCTTNTRKPDLVENDQSAKSNELRKSIIYRPISYAITTCGELHIRKCIWDIIKSHSSILIYRGSKGNISYSPTLKKTLYIAPLSEKLTLDKIYFSVYFIEDMRSDKLVWTQKRCILNSSYDPLVQPSRNRRFSDCEDLHDLENNIGKMLEKFIKAKSRVERSSSKCAECKNSLDLNSNEQNTLVSKAGNVTDLVPVINHTNGNFPQSPLNYLEFENLKSSNCNENEVSETINFDDSSSKFKKVVLESDRIGNKYNNCDKDDVPANVYFNYTDLEIEDTPQSLLDGDEYVFCLSSAETSEAEEANNELCEKNCSTNISNQLLDDSPSPGEFLDYSEYSLKEHALAKPAIVTSEDLRSSECPLKETINLSSANMELGSIEIMGIQFPQVDNQTVLNLSSNNYTECSIWQDIQLEDVGYESELHQSYYEAFSTNYNELVLYPDLQCYETLEMTPTTSNDILWISDYFVDPANDENDDPEKTNGVKCLNEGDKGMQEAFFVSTEDGLNSFSNGQKGYSAANSHNKHNDLACAELDKSVSSSQQNLQTMEVQPEKRISNWLPSTSKNERRIDMCPSSFPTIGDCVLRSTDSNGSDFSIKTTTRSTCVASDDTTIYIPIPQMPGFENVFFEPYIPTNNEMPSKSLSQQLKEFMESTEETNDSKNLTEKSETKSKRATLKRKSTETQAGSARKRSKVSRAVSKKPAGKAVTPKCMLSNRSVAVPVRQLSKTVENNSPSLHPLYSSSVDPFSILRREIAERYKLGNQTVYVKDLLKINKFDLIAREVKMSDILP